METSLHRDLKRLYAGDTAAMEVRVGNYRIDVVAPTELIEIQHGPLWAIRDKVRSLLAEHQVLVVKPIVASKLLIQRTRRGGRVASSRRSPKRGKLLDLFDELVHFTRVFPHSRLAIDVVLVDVEEWRYPGHGRRRRHRASDHLVEDQKLVAVRESHRLQTADDLRGLVSCELPSPFHTGHLAERLSVPRWLAQRVAYCLRQMGAARSVGKQRNALLYEFESGPHAPREERAAEKLAPGNDPSQSLLARRSSRGA